MHTERFVPQSAVPIEFSRRDHSELHAALTHTCSHKIRTRCDQAGSHTIWVLTRSYLLLTGFLPILPLPQSLSMLAPSTPAAGLSSSLLDVCRRAYLLCSCSRSPLLCLLETDTDTDTESDADVTALVDIFFSFAVVSNICIFVAACLPSLAPVLRLDV